MADAAAHILTVVDVFFIIDIYLHQPDQHPRQNTQEVQVRFCLTHLTMEQKIGSHCKYTASSLKKSKKLRQKVPVGVH